MTADPRTILDFWFKEVDPKRWFVVDAAFDADIKARFEQIWRDARDGKYADWQNNKQGTLALIILFDQFPRNMFRGTAEAFSTDALAQAVAKHALARGDDIEAPAGVRSFYYLPLMHSEDLVDQDTCVKLTRERLGEGHSSFPYAIRHRAAVERFGRFPARNRALRRETTPEEAEFLKDHPAGF